MARDGTRLALFIDGANAHATAKALGCRIRRAIGRSRDQPITINLFPQSPEEDIQFV
jgi:hypothetical protein